MTPMVYLNGAFVSAAEAAVNVYDGGLLHGAGLFETMRAACGCVFRLEAHLDRLRRSAETLISPITREALPSGEVLGELLERNALRDARVRLTLSAGPIRSNAESTGPSWTVCATAAALGAYPEAFYKRGVHTVICNHKVSPSDPLAGHKTTNYLSRLIGLRQAQQARCVEALWFTTGHLLAEASISNVFVVRGGVLKTPPLDTPVLPGIARGVVLEIARREGIEASECPLTINDLFEADEVLLTNSIMQVLPVVRVERHDIGGGRVGPMAGKLLSEYRNVVGRECGVE